MYFKRKELSNKKTDTLKSILINKGDDMSLYTVKLINSLEAKINSARCCEELPSDYKPIDGGTSFETLGSLRD